MRFKSGRVLSENMRSADSLSQINDDEFFTGGPCPSCRLAIDKETGRLKWCMGGNDTWRFRVKLMLLIPAVLLPITIIFIVLSRTQITNKSIYHPSHLTHPTLRQDERTADGDFFLTTTHSEVERSSDVEDEDKVLFPGMKTNYIPVETALPSRGFHRRKRNVDGVPFFRHDAPVSSVENTKKKLDNTFDDYYLDEGSERDEEEKVESEREDYTDYGSGEPTSGDNRGATSFGELYEDTNDDEYSNEDTEDSEGDQDRVPVYRSGMMPKLAKSTNPDVRIFWKDEGDVNSIKEAQAKIMLGYMDRTVKPCEDFYQYACGNWGKQHPIPKDKAAYDTFEMIRESLDSVLKQLLEDPVPHHVALNKDDAIVKAKDLFKSCMNYEILEQRMEQPLLDLLDDLGGWPILRPDWDPEKFDWLLLVARLRLYNNDILISEWVAPDIKNNEQYVIQFDQTSLGLPTRDYFLESSNTIYLEAYKSYLIKIATLLGASLKNATIDAQQMIDFETNLAKITITSNQRRNVSELYHRMSIGELRSLVPQINWYRYLTIVLARPANISEPVVVFALQYIQDLVNLLSRTHPRTIANYLLWRFVRHRVNNLDHRFQDAKQTFYFTLFGREQSPPRWKNCVAQVNSNMGMAVGSMFVRKYFDEKSKNDTLSMTRDIQRAFKKLLSKTYWIFDETKELAIEKVNAMLLTIGYPDFILHPRLLNERYKDVVIRPDMYFENTLNILQHLTRIEQDRLGRPVNKSAWFTAPADVNAYYSRSKNRIMFPAGILQPPFYHRHFPRSLNYGGIGAVIGHEITHGFDDKGGMFDKDGNLYRWWQDAEIYVFHQRAQCLIDQYSRYTVNEVGMQIDGINTQGENIADNGGIKQAFRAYDRWLRLNGDEGETLPGINATGRQLFFLNFAQLWCGAMRPEATKNKLKTAVHSPGKFRVIGTLSNSEEFAEVYNCPLGTPMNPVNKCAVW